MQGRNGNGGRDRWDREPPSRPPAALVVTCDITTPANGDVVVGPWNGVTVVLRGTAQIISGTGTIERVEVRVGEGDFQSAQQVGGSFSNWTVSELIPASGTFSIAARAIIRGQPYGERTIMVSTVLAPRPPGDPDPAPDTSPPEVSITAPSSGTVLLLGPSNQKDLEIVGTAADHGSGVASVEVVVDGLPGEVVQTNGSWRNWTARARLIGAGKHTVSARAVDTAGNGWTSNVELTAAKEPVETPAVERLLIVEKLQLSTFLGAYGAGRTIKTLSLLPGETTTIAVKSYQRTSETATSASSILDSYTDESQHDFETTLGAEQANKQTSQETSSWELKGQANVSWGFGSASITAGATGGSNASREELVKNIANSVTKHAATASARRDVEVKASREMRREEGEEFSSESHVKNINLSRTLNFVFRQMNQEFLTVLHLVDVRIAYVRGDVAVKDGKSTTEYTYQEVTLSQLDGLLEQVVVADRRADVRREIMNVLKAVFDYSDERHEVVEECVLKGDDDVLPNGTYLRFPKKKKSSYKDPVTGTEIEVPGVILAVMKNVMRTDGVSCDTLLGDSNALDLYSQGLQREAVEAREIENNRQRLALEKDALALKLVEAGNVEGGKLFKDVFPAPESESLALVTASPRSNEDAGAGD